MTTPHRIRRLTWQVTTANTEQAFAARHALRALHEHGWLDDLGAVFDAFDVGDRVIRIPTLSCRLSIRSVDAIGNTAREVLMRELVESIAASVAEAGGGAGSTAMSDVGSDGSTADGVDVDVFAHYLRHGVIPWPAVRRPRADVVKALRTNATAAPVLVSALLADTTDVVAAVHRWLALVDIGDVLALADHLEQSTTGNRRLRALIVALAAQLASHPAVAARSIAALLGVGIDRAMRRTGGATAAHAEAVFASIESSGQSFSSAVLGSSRAALDWIQRSSPSTLMSSVSTNTHEDEASAARPPLGTPSSAEARNDHPATHGFALPVANAGIVLLHPFLPRLFQRMGIQLDQESMSTEMRVRAATLLSYAALGEDDPQEFDLPLIKVLVGVLPETPLPVTAGTLSGADRHEVDEMLASAIEHWQALKRTTVDGLRTTFLHRDGLLSDDERSWRLRVEARGFDVLLGQLPWAISTVILPWMTRPLFTEWTATA